MDRQTPFFRAGGTMDPGAPSYIEREADTRLLEALLRGEYVFLLDSRQKGKSSMVARMIVSLKDKGVKTVKLDLQRIGANVTPEQWYAGMLSEIEQELGLRAELFKHWGAHQAVGPLARWIGALLEIVLAKSGMPIVIFIDEVDFVRALPFPTDEFFAGIRDCYNRRSEGKGFERLTFCLVGVATPGQLIRNPEITPFNIGTRIDLSDFTLKETQRYAAVLDGGGRSGARLMSRVHHWLNGHPYLTQLLCSHIASDSSIRSNHEVDSLVQRLFVSPEARQREPNFADVERRILDPDVPGLSPEEKRTQVLELYGKVLKGKKVEAAEENPVVATLRLSGVGLEDKRALRVRNRLYGVVFDERWRKQSLPDAEMRRQRGAARVALLRTAAMAGVVLLGVTTVAYNTNRLSNERRQALTDLSKRTQDLASTSDERRTALATLTERNQELSRLSQQRQLTLKDLQTRSEELQRVSEDRRLALADLQLRGAELRRTSEERGRALNDLSLSTNELKQRNYVGLMASIRLAMQESRWMLVSELIDKSKGNPLRGWEWGHVAMQFRGHIAEASLLPIRNEFEWDPDGSLSLITRDAIYEVTTSGLKLRRKFRGRTVFPLSRIGDLRMGIDPVSGRYVLRNATSDRIELESDALIQSVDPQSKTMIVSTPDWKLQKRSFDDKVLEEIRLVDRMEIRPARLHNGDQITLYRDGQIVRTDSNGKKVAESQIDPPPQLGKHSTIGSRDQSLFVHIDWNTPRPLQVRAVKDLNVVSTLEGPAIMGGTVAFSLDNRRILVARNGMIVRYDVQSGKALQSYFGHKSNILRLQFLPDGKHFASLDRSGTLKVWAIDAAPAVRELGTYTEPPIGALEVSDDGRFLQYITASRAFALRNVQTGAVFRLEKPAGSYLTGPMTVVSGSHAFVGTASGRVDRFSIDGLKLDKSIQVFDGPVHGLARLMGGKRLLVTTDSVLGHTAARFAIIDPESLAVLHRFRPGWHGEGVSYSSSNWVTASDGPLFAFCVNEIRTRTGPMNNGTGLILLISATSGKILRRMSFHEAIDVATFSPDGSKLIVSFYTGLLNSNSRIAVIDTGTGKEVSSLQKPPGNAIPMYFWMKGDLLTGFLADGNVGLWNLAKGPSCTIIAPGQPVHDYELSPNQDRLLTCLADGTAMVWDTKTGEDLYTLRNSPSNDAGRGPIKYNSAGVFSLDGGKIYISGTDGVLRVFDSVKWK